MFAPPKYHRRNSIWSAAPFRKTSLNFIIGCVVILIIFTSLKLHSARITDKHHQFNYFASFIVPSEIALDSIQDSFLRNYIKEISLDKYEGRATGSKGEKATVDFLEQEMRRLHPHLQTRRQNVPLTSMTLGSSRVRLNDADLIPNEDIWINMDNPMDAIELTIHNFVFVGYGIKSKSYNWDDYKGFDVHGKFLLAFVNEPDSGFKGEELTYFGRWMYKLEEARRRGARGIFFIHTEETAGYPFTVITSQTEMVSLEKPPKNPLEIWGWISENTANKLIKFTNNDLNRLFELANSPKFKPFEISTKFLLDLTLKTKKLNGINLIGWIPGLSDETVVYSAHHDHLGTGVPNKEGDKIYNGALDNASGLSMLLSVLNAFSLVEEPPRRTVAFICFTAEENGLLGSLYYIQNQLFPKTIANINFDIGNVHGKTLDIVGLGYDKSDLGLLFEAVAGEEDLTISPDPRPEQGSFYRADSFAFAKAGIPSIYPWTGMYFENQPSDYYLTVRDNYVKNDYHKQSDEYDESWSMEGMIQQVRVAFRLGYVLSNTDVKVSYYKGDSESYRP